MSAAISKVDMFTYNLSKQLSLLYKAHITEQDEDDTSGEVFYGVVVGEAPQNQHCVAWIVTSGTETTFAVVDASCKQNQRSITDADDLLPLEKGVVMAEWPHAVAKATIWAENEGFAVGTVQYSNTARAHTQPRKPRGRRRKPTFEHDSDQEDFEDGDALLELPESSNNQSVGATSASEHDSAALPVPAGVTNNSQFRRSSTFAAKKMNQAPIASDPSTWSYIACAPDVRSQASRVSDTSLPPGPRVKRGVCYSIEMMVSAFLHTSTTATGYGTSAKHDPATYSAPFVVWLSELADETREAMAARGAWIVR